MILRDFLTSEDFTVAFNAKYPDKLKARLTPEFMEEYEKLLEKKNYQLSPKQADQIRQTKDLLRKNPSYYQDINSLLQQRAKLIEVGKSIEFNEQQLAFTEKEIDRLKNLLPQLVAKREALLNKEYPSSLKLRAYDEFKKIARRRIDAFEKLLAHEQADQTTKNGLETTEPGDIHNKSKESWERENAKKASPTSTTGRIIEYVKDLVTGKYKDKINEDKDSPEYGLPLFTENKSQLLWAKFLDDNVKMLTSGEYSIEFHLHNPNGDSALDKQISANIPADKVDAGNDIYAVIVDKSGKPITVSGQNLFTGIHKVNTLFPEEGGVRLLRENAVIAEFDPGLANYLDGTSKATAIKIKYQDKNKTIAEWQKEGIWDEVFEAAKQEIFAKAKEQFTNHRNSIKAKLTKGEKAFAKIQSVSNGIPYLDKKLKSAKEFLGDNFILDYDLTGTFIATTEDGKKIPIQGDKLTDKDIQTVIEILKYAFPKGEEHFNGTIKLPKGADGKQFTYQGQEEIDIFPMGKFGAQASVLGSLIYYGRSIGGAKKFNIWGKGQSIQFIDDAGNTHVITRDSLYQPTSQGYLDLQSFLATKNLNFNRAFLKNGLYFHPIVSKGEIGFKIYKNYSEFVKERAKTYVHKTSDDHPIATNRYLTFGNLEDKPKEEKKIVAKEKEDVEFDEDMDPDDLITQRIENAKKKGTVVSSKTVVKGPLADTGVNLDEIGKPEATDNVKEGEVDLGAFGVKEEKKVETKDDELLVKVNDNENGQGFVEYLPNLVKRVIDLAYDGNIAQEITDKINEEFGAALSKLVTRDDIKDIREYLGIPKSNVSVMTNIAGAQIGDATKEEVDNAVSTFNKWKEKIDNVKGKPSGKTTSKLNVTRKPKGKERVATLTNEDALKRLRELVQSGEVEKKCS